MVELVSQLLKLKMKDLKIDDENITGIYITQLKSMVQNVSLFNL